MQWCVIDIIQQAFRSMAMTNTQMQRIWMKSTSNCNLHLREHFNDKFCFNDWGGSWKIMIEACMNLVRSSSYKHQDNLFACWHLPPQSLKQKLTSKCSLRCRFQFEILFIQILCIWVFAKAILLNTIICFLCILYYWNNNVMICDWNKINFMAPLL